eukprot:GFUD01020361.1.p1 GENE.GFUD01020361.1~~GFUD01020361.1.p1  ORF type:complete len:250 (-),score=72.05 GFUD01020361.1:178-927(-)
MGFLRKYCCLGLICLLFVKSCFFSVYTLCDVMGEVHHQNYSTRLELEELVVGDNDSLVYSSKKTILDTNKTVQHQPLPGYQLYWTIMHPVSGWYEPPTYQMVKLIIITVSLLNLSASFLALFCHMLYSCGNTSSFWLCHPTPLLLVEGGLTLALAQTVIMIFLGRQSGLMDTQQMMMVGLYMIMLMTVSWVVGEHYQAEQKIYEESLIEYETVPDDENDEVYDNIAHENDVTEEFVGNRVAEENMDRHR